MNFLKRLLQREDIKIKVETFRTYHKNQGHFLLEGIVKESTAGLIVRRGRDIWYIDPSQTPKDFKIKPGHKVLVYGNSYPRAKKYYLIELFNCTTGKGYSVE